MKLKKITSIIIIVLFMILLSYKTYAKVVDQTNEFYVNDYANLLDEDIEQYIIDANLILNRECGAQIVVTTIPSLEGASIEEYATELFRKFGIGDKNKNNGLLLLIALDERMFRIEVGYGLEGIIPDSKAGKIQNEYVIPYLKENKWNEGIKSGFNELLKIVANEYSVNIDLEGYNTNNEVTEIQGSTEDADDDSEFADYFLLVLGFFIGKNIAKDYSKILKGIVIAFWGIIAFFLIVLSSNSLYYFITNLIITIIGAGIGILLVKTGISDTLDGFFFRSGSGSSGGGGGSSGGGRKFRRILVKFNICIIEKNIWENGMEVRYFNSI